MISLNYLTCDEALHYLIEKLVLVPFEKSYLGLQFTSETNPSFADYLIEIQSPNNYTNQNIMQLQLLKFL
jgi:hypothetical protein